MSTKILRLHAWLVLSYKDGGADLRIPVLGYRAYSGGVAIYDKRVCANSIEAPSAILSV